MKNPPPTVSRRVSFTTDAAKWRAVLRRDGRADGRFVFSVATTGVYCRPSCTSRPARRENVAFHANAGAAERAGFRPCKRCRPDGPAPAEEQAAAIARACRRLESKTGPPTLDALARTAGMSRHHFHRVFKRVTGVTPKAFALAARARRLRDDLPLRRTVTEAIHGAGYGSSSRFYEKSRGLLGMQPRDFQRGGAGMTIRFATGTTSLGAVLAAASDLGICAVLLGDDRGNLVKELRRRFPKAALVKGTRAFQETVAAVVRLVESPRSGLGLPLDLRGTAFQQRVWQALREIPPGATAGYAEIAARLKLPGGARAVAQACGANPVAVAVPCHRVVRTDGALSGYRWGVDRKRALLDRERA